MSAGWGSDMRIMAVCCGVALTTCLQAAEADPRSSMMIDGIEISDPTRPLDWRVDRRATPQSESARPKLKLSSILISPARRLAIINGRSIAEGDIINGVTVQRLTTDGVQLRWQGEQWTLRLPQRSNLVRTPPRTQP